MDKSSIEINIALAVDHNYLLPAETLIKSICCWHKKVNFYLLHSGDIPNTWIQYIQAKLALFDSHLTSIVLSKLDFPLHHSVVHRETPITTASFYRYFIPELIDKERVLYLDSDILIDGDLSALFTMDLVTFPLAAVYDIGMSYVSHYYQKLKHRDPNLNYQGGEDFKPYLNSGVLLFDIKKCKERNLTKRLVFSTLKYTEVKYGDQDIFNFTLFREWLDLGIKYNYQILLTKQKIYPITEKPIIIHYTGYEKPWLDKYRHTTMLHQLYWAYVQKSWEDIILK